MLQPPSLPKRDTRRYPRHELQVSVEVRHRDRKLVMPARNVSLGGLYLLAGKRHALQVGDTVEVAVFDALDDRSRGIFGTARVLRSEAQGIALGWSTTDPVLADRLAAILERRR